MVKIQPRFIKAGFGIVLRVFAVQLILKLLHIVVELGNTCCAIYKKTYILRGMVLVCRCIVPMVKTSVKMPSAAISIGTGK